MTKSITNKRIENVAKEVLDKLAMGENPNLYQIQKDHGYSESSAKSYKVTRTKAWKQIMDEVDDDEIISRFMSIIRDGKDRDAITAGKEVLALKGRYPKQSVTEGYKRTIKDLLE